ncbi:hypothetical protein ACVWZ3_001707 [Bradyrhizobium sp. i1.3.6]
MLVVGGTLLLALAGLPLLYFLKFDFNPMNLRNPKAESIATFLDLRKDPNTGANAINVMTTSEEQARQVEAKLEKVPEVLRVMSLDSFVPTDQAPKLKLLAQGAKVLNPALNPDQVDAAPTDKENVEALKSSVDNLRRTAGDTKGPGRRRLAPAGGRARKARQWRRGHAEQGAGRVRHAAEDRVRPAQERDAGRAGHPGLTAPRARQRLEEQGRDHPRRGAAEGRSQ